MTALKCRKRKFVYKTQAGTSRSCSKLYTKYHRLAPDRGQLFERIVNKMSTMMRIPVELKEQVEILQGRFHAKSQADVLEKLIKSLAAFDDYQKLQTTKWEQEKQRKADEDIYLGHETKNKLLELQKHIGLNSPAQTVEFLIEVFDSTMDIGKLAFLSYVEMKKKG